MIELHLNIQGERQRPEFAQHFFEVLQSLHFEIDSFVREHVSCLSPKHQVSLTLVLCDDEWIQQLNHSFRQKNTATDVLSFPIFDNLRHDSEELNVIPEAELGDVVISLETAERQSEQFEVSLQDECLHLFVHGLCHLLGYDHEISDQEEQKMTAAESQLLESFTQKLSKNQ
jgi:probable rRNA maturation factor